MITKIVSINRNKNKPWTKTADKDNGNPRRKFNKIEIPGLFKQETENVSMGAHVMPLIAYLIQL